MASYAVDKVSTSSGSAEGKHLPGYTLDEKRRAALAEVDNAKFSSVSFSSSVPNHILISIAHPGGST